MIYRHCSMKDQKEEAEDVTVLKIIISLLISEMKHLEDKTSTLQE